MIDAYLHYDIFVVKLDSFIYYDYAEANKAEQTYNTYYRKGFHPHPTVNVLIQEHVPVIKILMRVNGSLNPPLLVRSLAAFANPTICLNQNAGCLIDKPYGLQDAERVSIVAKTVSRQISNDASKVMQKVEMRRNDEHTANKTKHKRHKMKRRVFWEGSEYNSVAELCRCNANLALQKVYTKLRTKPDSTHYYIR